MINDKIRMSTYEQAIKILAKNQDIIDVGAGTGILSIFAAQAGANHVYAIEASKIAGVAKQTFKDNDL